MFRFRPRRAMALLTAISLLSFSPCALAESSLYPGAPSISDYSSLSDEEKAAIPLINASHPLPEDLTCRRSRGARRAATA